jgi:hypothetical protein
MQRLRRRTKINPSESLQGGVLSKRRALAKSNHSEFLRISRAGPSSRDSFRS